jgi:hypothetical protein
MEQNNKLYKCYKPGCNFGVLNENPFLTQFEYDELLQEGKITCPENTYGDSCGIKELNPEDYPKPIKDKKKLYTLIGAGVGVLLIVISAFFMLSGNSTPEPAVIETPAITVENEIPVETTVEETPVITEVEAPAKIVEEVVPAAPLEKAKPVVVKTTTPSALKGTQTKSFSGGSKYVGEMKNGQMQGLGTFYYGQHELISPRDLKKRYAEAGDYLIGEFYEGKVVSGKLYDSGNNLKEVMMIGR